MIGIQFAVFYLKIYSKFHFQALKVSKNKLVRTVRRGVLPLFQCEQMELFPTVNKLFQFFFFETNFQLYLRVVFNVFPDPLIKSNWHLVDNLVLHLNFYVTFYSVFFFPLPFETVIIVRGNRGIFFSLPHCI